MVLIQRCLLNGYMVDEWLVKSAQKYNKQSLENKDGYPAFILMPITTLEKIINWTFQSLPDEILVGMDPNPEIKNPKKIEDLYRGVNFQNKLFADQGYLQYRTFGYGHSFGVLSHFYGREAGLELREDINTVLEENMVISMEPMILIPEGKPGAGGYREHDILVIGKDGAENITKFPFGPENNIING